MQLVLPPPDEVGAAAAGEVGAAAAGEVGAAAAGVEAEAAGSEAEAAGAEAAGAEATGAEVAMAGSEREAVTVTSVVMVEVGSMAAALEALGAKTPPGLLVGMAAAAEDWTAEDWTTAAEDWAAAAEVAPPDADAPPDGDAPPPETALPQAEPVGGSFFAADSSVTTFWPGSGNSTLKFGGVLQSTEAMLATNMSGSWSNLDVSLAPPVTVTGAQFMYSSGPPLSLENQVQARVTCPFGMLSGILKLNWSGWVVPGHPPSIDMMTLNLELAVGTLSVVMLSWQLPPP